MESGLIKDEDLTASSSHDSSSVGPRMSRIRSEIEGGAWCPGKPIGPKSSEYLQIDLHELFFISAIETQGRFDNGQGNEYAEFYQIQYQRDSSASHWFTYSNGLTNKTVKSLLLLRLHFICSRSGFEGKCEHVRSRETRSPPTDFSQTNSHRSDQFALANGLSARRTVRLSDEKFVSALISPHPEEEDARCRWSRLVPHIAADRSFRREQIVRRISRP